LVREAAHAAAVAENLLASTLARRTAANSSISSALSEP
jgi:hypothetical protein